MKLKGKTALVTGASSGIGQAIAKEFAKKGAIVLINYRKNEKGAKETLKEVAKYSTGEIFQADVSDQKQTKRMFQSIKKKYKTVDVLINNAGDAKPGELGDYKLWKYQLKNILLSSVITTNEFLAIKSKKISKIINISSIYGILETGNQNLVQYSAAKAAMNSLTKNLAKKYGPKVLVNAIAPGSTWTPPWYGTSEKTLKQRTSIMSIKRFIKPEEIAHVAVMLAENDAITGQIIIVDGGVSLKEMGEVK